jgi:tRNA-modifying protein YgfZ
MSESVPSAGERARKACALRRLGRSTVLVTGSDRRTWLNGVITQEVPTSGKGAYGLALSRPGKVQGDVFCLELGDRLLVATPPAAHAALLDTWENMLVMEDAELSDVSAHWEWFLSVGPERPQLPAGAIVGDLDLLGLGGVLVALPSAGESFTEAPAWLDDETWRELRLERLLPEFGVDFGEQERPHEASLDKLAVSWSKGCYLGQEVVCMQEMRGKVKRRLEVLRAAGPLGRSPAVGEEIQNAEGKTVGAVTSFANSRHLGAGLVMGRLDVAAREQDLRLAGGGESLAVLAVPA